MPNPNLTLSLNPHQAYTRKEFERNYGGGMRALQAWEAAEAQSKVELTLTLTLTLALTLALALP